KKTALANDKETYGGGLARIFVQQAKAAGFTVTGNDGIDKSASNYRAYASKVKAAGADCFLFSGVTANGAVQLYKDVGAAVPNARLYGPDGVCESGFTNPKKKGIPTTLGKRFICSVATLNLTSIPGGKAFVDAFAKRYGDRNPDPYAIYGYEAAKLRPHTIARLGSKGTHQSPTLDA